MNPANDNGYDKKKMLKGRIHRFYSEGYIVWKKEDILKHELTIEESLPWIKEWEQKGYIKFIGEDDKYFKVLKEIDE